MDSLLQSYASSDDEEEEQQPISKSVEVLSEPPQPLRSLPSLPPPKSSGLSSLLPPPKTSSSVFSSLPPPNTSSPFSSLPTPSALDPKPKRVVQFRPPPMVKPPIDDDDDEEEERRRKLIKETPSNPTSSLSSFFSSLPAPRNTLGSGSAPSLGAGRRSIIETNITPPSNYEVEIVQENEGVSINESQEPLTSVSDLSSYPYYEDNNHQNYGNYDIVKPSAASLMPPPPPPEASGFFGRKRGRNDMATEVIEVKQDELMKNRPREDQAKSTGIAFGPSFQPGGTATSSGKGKPSKLHKRKHQIGALYFDMRAKESELAERRSKGFLTKAETQAKYGW